MITEYDQIINQIDKINPIKYSSDRNFIDGSVSKLSPYISRGVISTRQVLNHLLDKGFETSQMQKFIQELSWRDYWQRIWQEKDIDVNIKHDQENIFHKGISKNILDANTSIVSIDKAINELYNTGYMHNHLRMYVAALATNIAKSEWKIPAQWMYYHLLDGDWASNALSWQWVCGANSNKRYIANQENINRYTYSSQQNTFLDTSYECIMDMDIPARLTTMSTEVRITPLPTSDIFEIDYKKPICIYNYYNLDPKWRLEFDANRILLIEPSIFKKYPIGQKSINFMLSLAKNIKSINIFVGEFHELKIINADVYFKEHPLNYNYKGIEDSRDWMSSVKGYYPSFFNFWKKVKKEL